MSDVEETPVVEVAAGSTAPGEISVEDALQVVIRNALKHHQGVARGLREAVKALQSEYAELCVLCDSVTEESYAKLVEALCQEPENPIPLIKVSDAKKLGEWAGLSKLDRDGNARKVVGCSCLVIRQFGDRSPELDVLLNYFKSQ